MSQLIRKYPNLTGYVSILDYGAKGNGVTDDIGAVKLAKAATGRVFFPRIGNKATTYYLGAFNAGDLDGMTIRAEDGVTLSVAANGPYAYWKAIKFASDVRMYFRDVSRAWTFAADPDATKRLAPAIAPAAIRRTRGALDMSDASTVFLRTVAWNASDVFNDTVSTAATSQSVTLAAGGANIFKGVFTDIGVYETLTAIHDNGLANGPMGVIVRGANGFVCVYAAATAGNYTMGRKLTGQASSQRDITWPQFGQGTSTSMGGDKSVWSVSRVDRSKAIVRINGKAITGPYLDDVGDIYEVGFVYYTGAAVTISALTLDRRTDAAVGMPELSEFRIYGDSTAEGFPGSWDKYLAPILRGHYGLNVNAVTNYAVAGQDLGQQYTSMQANGFGNAYHVIVCCGTNNVQGAQDMASYKTLVGQVLDYIKNAGRVPVIVSPWFWYTRAQAPDGNGQAAVNYDMAAPYRQWMERLAIEKGAILVRLTEELPYPSPGLVTSNPLAPLLRDNIHPDQLAHQLYAQAICKAVADDYLALPDAVEEALAVKANRNTATADPASRYCYGKGGMVTLNATFNITTPIANNTAIHHLPRHALPLQTVTVPALAIDANGLIAGMCWVGVQANGDIIVEAVPNLGPQGAAVNKLVVNATWKQKVAP